MSTHPVPDGDDGLKLRRPSDLARETRRSSRPGRRGGQSEEPPPEWPKGFAATDEDRDALLVLAHLATVTARHLLGLAAGRLTASACLAAVIQGVAGSAKDSILAASLRPEELRERLTDATVRLIAVGDPEYPPALYDLHDPPAALFARGALLQRPDLMAAAPPRVSIVGARNCSQAGEDTAAWLAGGLARAGVCVVSGGARGIDAAAHRGALDAGGSTVAVLGCGADVAYPRMNRSLLDRVVATAAGTLVSEYPPGTPAEPFRFPARNRIVAALGQGVVIVEGAQGSGSMITAEHALDLGREVFAIPGPVAADLSHAPHALIREGATLIRGAEDLLADLKIGSGIPTPGSDEEARSQGPGRGLAGMEGVVFAAIGHPVTPDSLAAATGMALREVVSTLTLLEVRGFVMRSGGRYQRRPGR